MQWDDEDGTVSLKNLKKNYTAPGHEYDNISH